MTYCNDEHSNNDILVNVTNTESIAEQYVVVKHIIYKIQIQGEKCKNNLANSIKNYKQY